MIPRFARAMLAAATALMVSLPPPALAGQHSAAEAATKAADQPPPEEKEKRCAKPVWPQASLRYEEQGTVTMRFLVGTDGYVKQSELIKSSGFRMLDAAALEGISKCKFKPATKDGVPEETWVPVQYVWALR